VTRGTEGGTFVEYAIIVGVVALLGIGAFVTFGASVSSKLAREGERVASMEGQIRSNDSTRPAEAVAEHASAENSLVAQSKNAWGSPSEASHAASRSATGAGVAPLSPLGDSAVITVEPSSPAVDAVSVIVAVLLIAGSWLVYRWKRGRRAAADSSADGSIEEMLAPATRWMASLRGHMAGRLPWTPRE
jgi:Flp pilus assembly pilin Flp